MSEKNGAPLVNLLKKAVGLPTSSYSCCSSVATTTATESACCTTESACCNTKKAEER